MNLISSNPRERTRRKCQLVRSETGYRSALEADVAKQLEMKGITGGYETARFSYMETHNYIPDFILPNGVILEVKGYFDVDDRSKMLSVKEQHPELDIRFIFNNPNTKLNKKSKTTYGAWCDKHGFPYAKQTIPGAWLCEI